MREPRGPANCGHRTFSIKEHADMTKGKGLYLGTEIDEKWWRRYKKDKMFARGNGHYWYDDQGFYFHRYLTKNPLYIPWSIISEIKLGKSHAGRRFVRMFVLKIVWTRDDTRLSSGFLVSKHEIDTRNLLAELMQVCRGPRKRDRSAREGLPTAELGMKI